MAQTTARGVHDIAGKEDNTKIHSPLGTKAAVAAAAELAENKLWWAYAKIGRRHRDPTGGGYTVQGPARTLTKAIEWREDIGSTGRERRSYEVVGIRPHTDISAAKMGAGFVDVVDVGRMGPASSARNPSGCVPMRR